MKSLISKIENAVLIFCGLALLGATLWNLTIVFSNLSAYTSTQVFDTIMLTAMLLIFQLAILGVVSFNKNR